VHATSGIQLISGRMEDTLLLVASGRKRGGYNFSTNVCAHVCMYNLFMDSSVAFNYSISVCVLYPGGEIPII